MKSIFKDVKDKLAENKRKSESAQDQRIKHLQQLEANQDNSFRRFLNPIKFHQTKKEIRALKKEISAFEQAKQNRLILMIVIPCMIIIFACLFLFSSSSDAPDSPAPSILCSTLPPESSPAPSSAASAVHPTPLPTPSAPTSSASTLSSDKSGLSIRDIEIEATTDYAHIDRDLICLGQNEGVTITITADINNLTKEDIILLYDESLLSVQINDPIQTSTSSTLNLYVTGKSAGLHEIIIATAHDIEVYGEKASCYDVNIKQLDSLEGRPVYITSSGSKYHFSQNCAGESSRRTTYYDVMDSNLEPCKKCAN